MFTIEWNILIANFSCQSLTEEYLYIYLTEQKAKKFFKLKIVHRNRLSFLSITSKSKFVIMFAISLWFLREIIYN